MSGKTIRSPRRTLVAVAWLNPTPAFGADDWAIILYAYTFFCAPNPHKALPAVWLSRVLRTRTIGAAQPNKLNGLLPRNSTPPETCKQSAFPPRPAIALLSNRQ